MFVHFLYLFCTIFVQSFGNLDSPLFICPRYPKGLQIDNVMASIKFSGFGITEAAGKVGGNTVQRNKSGMFIKRSSRPGSNGSEAQVFRKVLLSNLAGSWRGLNDEQRRAWTMAANSGEWSSTNRLGEVKTLSGEQLFMELNGNLKVIDVPIITVPGTKPITPDFYLQQTTLSVGSNELDLKFTAGLGIWAVTVWATVSLSAGILKPSMYRLLPGLWDKEPNQTYQFYLEVFGQPITNAYVFIETFATDPISGAKFNVGQSRVLVT